MHRQQLTTMRVREPIILWFIWLPNWSKICYAVFSVLHLRYIWVQNWLTCFFKHTQITVFWDMTLSSSDMFPSIFVNEHNSFEEMSASVIRVEVFAIKINKTDKSETLVPIYQTIRSQTAAALSLYSAERTSILAQIEGCLGTWCQEIYYDLRGRMKHNGEILILRKFVICTLHQKLLFEHMKDEMGWNLARIGEMRV